MEPHYGWLCFSQRACSSWWAPLQKTTSFKATSDTPQPIRYVAQGALNLPASARHMQRLSMLLIGFPGLLRHRDPRFIYLCSSSFSAKYISVLQPAHNMAELHVLHAFVMHSCLKLRTPSTWSDEDVPLSTSLFAGCVPLMHIAYAPATRVPPISSYVGLAD